MIGASRLEALDPQSQQTALALMAEVVAQSERLESGPRELAHKRALIDRLTHQSAVLKRLKFAAQGERLTAEQRSLLDETFGADLAELDGELKRLGVDVDAAEDKTGKRLPRRAPLPPQLPRRDVWLSPRALCAGVATRCSVSAMT